MSEYCVFKPSVRNSEGELVESKLFNSLLHYSKKDREFAKKYYYLGTNEDFLAYYEDGIKFDENGEITFESLQKITKFNIEEEKVLSVLNKDIKAGEYEYSEALDKAKDFNENNPYSEDYIAILEPLEGGKVKISVEKKKIDSEYNNYQVIRSKSLIDNIKEAVQSFGGDISFIDEDYSKYDTEHAEKASSGLWNVIQLSKSLTGEKLNKVAAEEAGHFAVGMLSNHSLGKRLLDACTKEVQEEVLKGHDSAVNITDPRREAAGVLVGKFIAGEYYNQGGLQNLIDRFVNLVKKVVAKLSGNDVVLMRLKAEKYAKKIANDFMLGTLEGNIETALEHKEIRYSADSKIVSAFKEVIQSLDVLTAEMSSLDKRLYSKFNDITTQVAYKRIKDTPGHLADRSAFGGILSAMKKLIDTMPNLIKDVVELDVEGMEDMQQKAKTIRAAHFMIDQLLFLQSTALELSRDPEVVLTESEKENLSKLSNLINGITQGEVNLVDTLLKKEREFFANFLSDIYGESFITQSTKLLFGEYTLNGTKKFGLHVKEGETEEAKSYFNRLVTTMEGDSSWQNRWLASMSNSSDAINQLLYKTKTAANRRADSMVIQLWDDLRLLEEEAKTLGIDTDVFLERDSEGRITGNYISKLHWHDYEEAFKKFRKDFEDAYFDKHPEELNKFSIDREVKFDEEFQIALKEWHKQNSTWNNLEGRYYPKEGVYDNTSYDNLSETEKDFLEKLLDKKSELDNLLLPPYDEDVTLPGHTHRYRMPQFRGSTINRYKNLRGQMSRSKALLKVLRSKLINMFVANSNDRDYGSEATTNDLDASVFNHELLMQKQAISRVPLYGINKLQDMSEISTDLFAGLLQYGAMCATYEATSNIIDILEVGGKVFGERRVKGQPKNKVKDIKSNSYARYYDFMEMNFYNLYTKRGNFGKIVPQKVAQTFNSLASYVLLGGNLHGGIRNALSGFFEITKEAISGEHFTISELRKAHSIYFGKALIENLAESGKDVKNDKVSLFMLHFDVGSKTSDKVMEYDTQRSRLYKLNPFGENILLPYKAGDHYMQSMSYIASALHHKFKYKGEVISMWDAFDVVDIDSNNPRAGKTLKLKDGALFIDPITGEEREWLDGNNESGNNEDMLKFTNLCREVNNRMHGIYNKMDKPALAKHWAGQLILSMKGYALGYLYRRFSSNKYNFSLGHDTEGSVITAAKVFASMWSNEKEFLRCARLLILPFGENTRDIAAELNLSPHQYANLRRNWGDMFFIFMLALLKVLTGKGEDKDDEDENHALGVLHYFITGTLNEQAAFNTPGGLFVEANQLTTIGSPAAVNVLKLFYDMGKLAISGEEYKQGDLEGRSKFWRKFWGYTPWVRSYRVFEDPYKSTESYEYGRNIK